jgi:hypothetical protein
MAIAFILLKISSLFFTDVETKNQSYKVHGGKCKTALKTKVKGVVGVRRRFELSSRPARTVTK